MKSARQVVEDFQFPPDRLQYLNNAMPAPDSLQLKLAHRIEARRKRSNQILVVVAILCVVVPFLFWRGTWFGRPLSDDEISQYLSDKEKPRHSQHALVQVAERIGHGDPTVKRWYPQVASLTESPYPEIRVTLAWVMGADSGSEEFHQALRGLLQDGEPLVRRNAALSLVRFGDASGKPELLNMLRPYTVRSPGNGVLRYRLKPGDSPDRGTVLARLEVEDKEPLEIRSPLPGRLQTALVKDGSMVANGEGILVLSPGSEHIWEALRALYLVGGAEELPDVERFAGGSVPDVTPQIQQQAALTAAEIRRRSSSQNSHGDTENLKGKTAGRDRGGESVREK